MPGPDTITIPSRVECIDDARLWVLERARAAGLGTDAIDDLGLALTEALANVIEHAYCGAGDADIVVGTGSDDGAVTVHVRDWGRRFDRAAYAPRALDDPGEGGYGVFLIDQLMDAVTREPLPDGGTLLTLVKRKSGST